MCFINENDFVRKISIHLLCSIITSTNSVSCIWPFGFSSYVNSTLRAWSRRSSMRIRWRELLEIYNSCLGWRINYLGPSSILSWTASILTFKGLAFGQPVCLASQIDKLTLILFNFFDGLKVPLRCIASMLQLPLSWILFYSIFFSPNELLSRSWAIDRWQIDNSNFTRVYFFDLAVCDVHVYDQIYVYIINLYD